MPITELLMTVALLVLVPLSSNISYVLDDGMSSDLMEYAIWLVYLLPLLFTDLDVFQNAGERLACRTNLLRIGSFAMIAVFLWSNVLTANNAYLKKSIERQATLSSMTRAMSDLNNQPDYVWNETPVAFYGFDTEFSTLPGFEDVRQVAGMVDNSQITHDYHFAYIRYILNEDIALCDANQYKEISTTEALAQMPHFPEKGYIQMIDDVMVVKMGP